MPSAPGNLDTTSTSTSDDWRVQFFAALGGILSHSVHPDVECQEEPLDGQQLLVVEGKGVVWPP